MVRTLSVALALLPGPLLAASHHQAVLERPRAAFGVAVRNIYWQCGATGVCSGSAGTSRPVMVCAALARQVGRLKRFAADGAQLEPRDLEKCNAKAR